MYTYTYIYIYVYKACLGVSHVACVRRHIHTQHPGSSVDLLFILYENDVMPPKRYNAVSATMNSLSPARGFQVNDVDHTPAAFPSEVHKWRMLLPNFSLSGI